MDISNQTSLAGADLLEKIVSLTGLPSTEMEQELRLILDKSGINLENMTLDDLRLAMVSYLDSIHEDLDPIEPETIQRDS